MRLNVHGFKSLEDCMTWARDQIDQSAGKARTRYITVTAGQDATYQAKYADAQAFVRAGYPEDQLDQYPWVKAESEATQATAKDAADGIKAVGDPWNMVIGPSIESLRIGGKKAIDNMTSIGDVVSHTRLVQSQLNNI
jgi:hypothetical protein